MTRRDCEVCGKPIYRTALPRRRLCSPCRQRLIATIYRLIDDGEGLTSVERGLELPNHLAAALLRSVGFYPADWVSSNIGSVENLATVELPGMGYTYTSEEKTKDRQLIVEDAVRMFGTEKPIRALVLPHARMLDYTLFASRLNIVPVESLAVERDRVVYNHLASWVDGWWALKGGVIFQGLRTYRGKLSDALDEVDGEYDLVNLDFNGPWTTEVEIAVSKLFAHQRLADQALLCITLAESERWVQNPQFAKVKKLHRHFVVEKVRRAANKAVYSLRYRWHHGYKKNTPYPMITIVFKVRKKASSVR